MKIEVDLVACRSYAICVGIAPEYFELDEDGIVRLLRADVAPGDEDRVREAALGCPQLAIKIVE